MSNTPTSRGFQRSRISGSANQLSSAPSSAGPTIPALMSSSNNLPPLMTTNNEATQPSVVPKSSSGVVR
jgi:hypothetical protein